MKIKLSDPGQISALMDEERRHLRNVGLLPRPFDAVAGWQQFADLERGQQPGTVRILLGHRMPPLRPPAR